MGYNCIQIDSLDEYDKYIHNIEEQNENKICIFNLSKCSDIDMSNMINKNIFQMKNVICNDEIYIFDKFITIINCEMAFFDLNMDIIDLKEILDKGINKNCPNTTCFGK